MDFETLLRILTDLLDTEDYSDNYPIMICGRHGIGKSEIVYQLGKLLNMQVVERRVSQMQESDVLGMPSQKVYKTDKGSEYSKFNPFYWFLDCCENPRILFLDEFDRGAEPVKQAFMELTDSRKLFGRTLHPGTIVVSAINGGKHASNYQVGELDPAEQSRWTTYHVEAKVDPWLRWAKGKVHYLIWDFINQNRGHLFHDGDFEPGEIYPNPRSIVRLNNVMQRKDLFKNIKEDLGYIMTLASGFVGLGTAAAFVRFVENYEFNLTVENIINDGAWEKTIDWGINEHLAMTTKIGQSGIVSQDKLSKEQLLNMANYFMVMPSEVASVFWTIFCGEQEDNFENPNLVPFSQTIADNGVQVAEHFGKMLSKDHY